MRTKERRLRLELYPRLHEFERLRLNLILTAGISFRRRYHTLAVRRLPPEPEPGFDSGEGWPTIGNWGDASAYLLRDETRAEASVGVELRRDPLVVSLLAMPYWTTDYGSTSHRRCSGCDTWTLDEFEGRSGLALFISGGVTWTFFKLSGRLPKNTNRP